MCKIGEYQLHYQNIKKSFYLFFNFFNFFNEMLQVYGWYSAKVFTGMILHTNFAILSI